LKSKGEQCMCIRCREIKNTNIDINKITINTKKYEASNGIEYFISAETIDTNQIIGFLRLRLIKNSEFTYIKEIKNAALVRELHVYGQMKPWYLKEISKGSQHNGIGKQLLKKAESISSSYNYDKIAVISGVGVREYYKNRGYKLEGAFMTKAIYPELLYYYDIYIFILLILTILSFIIL
jgi:elongator complex protein 3